MSKIWSTISGLLIQLIDLLVDAIYLFLWAFVNWFLLRGLYSFQPSKLIVIFLWSAQGIFAAFSLAIILFHLFRDLKASEHKTSLVDVWGKLKDMANQLFSLIILSTLLIGWAVINSGLDLALGLFESKASVFVHVSHWIAQIAFAAFTLRSVVKRMYEESKKIYNRLFH